MRPLLPYQVAPFERIKRQDRPAIFIDKRLGKCTLAIRWAATRPGVRNVLIVAPKSAHPDWLREIEADGCSGCLYADIDPMKSDAKHRLLTAEASAFDPDLVFFIINPQRLFRSVGRVQRFDSRQKTPMPTEAALLPWDAIIWDESTSLRNPKTQTNKIAFACFYDIPYRAILSGDPVPESPMDLFEQFRWLHGKFMGYHNYWQFQGTHFRRLGFDLLPKLGASALIHQAKDDLAIVLNRKDAGVEPQKTFETRVCELPPRLRRVYDDAERYMEIPDPTQPGGVRETNYPIVTYNWLRRLAGGYPTEFMIQSDHKLKVLMELLTGEYAHEKVVVTFVYNDELREALKLCREYSVWAAPILGETVVPERQGLQDLFRKADSSVRVLLMQIKVARFGIDLSAADTMIRYSPSLSYEDMSQSMDRIVHPAKKNVLHYIDLVAEDTVDADIVETMKDKAISARSFMQRSFHRTLERMRAKWKEASHAKSGKQIPRVQT